MRTRHLTGLAAACMTAVAATSCGIPSSSAPEVVDEAPTDFEGSSQVEAEQFAPSIDAHTTVENFLSAAGAGDPDARDDRLNLFTDGGAEFSDPVVGIGLLKSARIEVSDGVDFDNNIVTVTGSIVGSYMPDGQVRMNPTERPYEEEFTLEREAPGEDWVITELPAQVVLLYSQFRDSYEQAPLYFQATGQSDLLVPDLRWIYSRLGDETEHAIRLSWLLQGPSDSVHSARAVIPEDTIEVISTGDDGTIQVELGLTQPAELDAEFTDPIAAQIAWSLGIVGAFKLTISGEEVAAGSLETWRGWNAIPAETDQIGYYISEDTVWQFEGDDVSDFSRTDPWVGFTAEGLRQVAVSGEGRIAAVVGDGGGSQLQTGTGAGDMQTVEDLDGDLRDPQWLTESSLILAVDGVITTVDTETGKATTLAGESVTALSVAPDGHRIVYVEGARAWAAALIYDADGNLQIGEAKRLGLNINEVTDVAWSSENYIWVAGVIAGESEKLFRVSIDNSRTETQSGTSGFLQAEQIAANPADPVESNQNRGEPTVVAIGSSLYRVHSTLQPIDAEGDGQPVGGTAPFTVL